LLHGIVRREGERKQRERKSGHRHPRQPVKTAAAVVAQLLDFRGMAVTDEFMPLGSSFFQAITRRLS
jgi:hypothetical protein